MTPWPFHRTANIGQSPRTHLNHSVRGLYPLLTTLMLACGGAQEPEPIVPPPVPDRSAAEDARVRLLLLDLAEAHLCETLRGAFMALPDADAEPGAPGGASPAAGRWWVKECEAVLENRDVVEAAKLRLELRGPGWTWAEQSTDGPLGSSFTVRGHLHFTAQVGLRGALDVAYADRRRLVQLWMTPASPASATVTPQGAIPVEPDGGWSSLIASVGSWFGPNLEERAAPMVEQHGSRQMAERLSQGMTFSWDLCSGQADAMVGPLENGTVPIRPFDEGHHVWLENSRIRLRPDGLDASGPYPAGPLRMDVEVEAGASLRVAAYCEADAAALVTRHLERHEAPPERRRQASATPPSPTPLWRARVLPGGSRAYGIPEGNCPVVLLAQPQAGAPDETVFRFRVFEQGARRTPLVSCPDRRRP